MEKLAVIYNTVRNPIDDPKVIEQLLQCFKKQSPIINGFYSALVMPVKKKNIIPNQKEVDAFYSMMFNKWKSNVLNLTKGEYDALCKQGSLDSSFDKMRTYLKGIPDIKTRAEFEEIRFGKGVDPEVKEAFKKFSWDSLDFESTWTHVCSRYTNVKKEGPAKGGHRLYINSESTETYKMVKLLVEHYEKHNMPYYFKFDHNSDRDDAIVIYTSTEDLMNNLMILQEIKKEHPHLVAKIGTPPFLTGKIDGWIGYGSEPISNNKEQNASYNSTRANLLEDVLAREVEKWFRTHKNELVDYQGKK